MDGGGGGGIGGGGGGGGGFTSRVKVRVGKRVGFTSPREGRRERESRSKDRERDTERGPPSWCGARALAPPSCGGAAREAGAGLAALLPALTLGLTVVVEL